eukprot:COSAG06_NODE_2670_length_6468_cov_2.579369_1_plen_167_part_10
MPNQRFSAQTISVPQRLLAPVCLLQELLHNFLLLRRATSFPHLLIRHTHSHLQILSQARVAAAAADGEAEKAGAVQKHPAAEAQQGGSTGAGADAVTRALAEEREENARLRAKLADAAEEVAQLRTTTEQAQRDAEDLKAQLQACKEAQLQAETARLVAESSAFSQS